MRTDSEIPLGAFKNSWSCSISPLIVKFVQNWQKNFFMTDKFLPNLNPNIEYRNSKQYRMTKIQISKRERVKLFIIELMPLPWC